MESVQGMLAGRRVFVHETDKTTLSLQEKLTNIGAMWDFICRDNDLPDNARRGAFNHV